MVKNILFAGLRKMLLGLLLPFCTGMSAQAQPGIQWQKALGGSGYDYSSAIEATRDSGYIVSGYTYSTDGDVTGAHGGVDIWIIKMTSAGTIEWQRTFGGSGDDRNGGIKQTADGGYIVAGRTSSVNGDVNMTHGGSDCWLIKLDSAGNVAWKKTYGGSGDEAANAIQQTNDGGYIVAGYTSSVNGDVTGFHGGTGPDCWIFKVNDTGQLVWQKTFGGTNDDEAVAIKQTLDGGYIFTGLAMSPDGDVTNYHGGTTEGGDCWVVKISDTGALQWQKTYGGSIEDQGFDILQTADGNYILGASTMSSNGDVANPLGQADAWLLKLNTVGGIIWQHNYGTSGSEYLTALKQTTDGSFLFAGWNSNMWVVKVDTAGTLLWQNNFGGTGEDAAWSLALATDGGCVLTGNTNSTNGDVSGYHTGLTGASDIWVVKVNPELDVKTITNTSQFPICVYPTVTTGTININIPGIRSTTEFAVFNMLGQRIDVDLMRQESLITLRMHNVAAGPYILRVNDPLFSQSFHISYQN